MNWNKFFKIILIVLTASLLITNMVLLLKLKSLSEQNSDLSQNLKEFATTINQKSEEIDSLQDNLSEKDDRITKLKDENIQLKYDLLVTNNKLGEITEQYEEAQPYQDRVTRGQNLKLFYPLLADYETFVRPIVLTLLGLSQPTAPKTDYEMWLRGKKIYNWISDNYNYCGDRGLRVGSTFSQFQFFSPDELLSVNNKWCGDCDDFATLFAGMLYASGVSYEDVYMVCGSVSQGGHCWNQMKINNHMYTIDSICSIKNELLNIFGFTWSKQTTEYPNEYSNVVCLDGYQASTSMTYKGIVDTS